MKTNLATGRLTAPPLRSSVILTIALCLFFNFGISPSALSQEQDAGDASITTDYMITLDNSEDLHHFYEADISHLTFRNKKDAQEHFKKMNDPAWTINVVWKQERSIQIILRPNPLTRTWSVDNWSMRLQEKAQQL